MERCPCCRARLGSASVCPRCQADLGKVIGAGQSAQFWLDKAIQHWQDNEAEQSILALEYSLRLNKTRLALAWRDFLVQQQSRAVLDLLAQKQLQPAKQSLYSVRRLFPHYLLLQELRSFTDYLWAKQQDSPNVYDSSNLDVSAEAGRWVDSSTANE